MSLLTDFVSIQDSVQKPPARPAPTLAPGGASTMTSKRRQSTCDLSDLHTFFGLPPTISSSPWYLQPNTTIPMTDGGHFDRMNPSGSHPALFLDVVIRDDDDPVAIHHAWVRSASCESMIQHAKHRHSDGTSCRVNALGWLVCESTFPILHEQLGVFSCYEPVDSPLPNELRKYALKHHVNRDE